MKTAFHFNRSVSTGIRKLSTLLFIICFFAFKTNASNYYWIGGSGNWDDLTHWATSSGGTTLYTQIPTALDDVYFDANSFTAAGQIVDFNPLTILVHSMYWTGVTHNPTLAAPAGNLLKIYGSLAFVPGMNMSFPGDVHFEATSAGQTITMGGKSFYSSVYMNGIGGEWTFLDDFTAAGGLSLNAGTLNTNDHSVNIYTFSAGNSSGSGPATALNIGASVINLTQNTQNGAWSTWNTVITSGMSVINVGSGSFDGGNNTYYDLNFTGGSSGAQAWISGGNYHNIVSSNDARITGTNSQNLTLIRDAFLASVNVLNDLTLAPGHSYELGTANSPPAVTLNGTIHANGTCNALINIFSQTVGLQGTISKATGVVNASYLVLKDIKASGGATFNAGNSSDLGNNTGWNFTTAGAQNLYWIGNGGNWSNGNHWSHTSGGAPSGCAPAPGDNVFFDANSFTTASQTVTIDPLIAFCRNMDWTGVTHNPVLTFPYANKLKISGSLAFSPNMSSTLYGEVLFEALTAGQTIKMSGNVFYNNIYFTSSGGEWTLLDDLTIPQNGFIYLNAGTLNSNNKTVSAPRFQGSSATLNMGASIFNVYEWWGSNTLIVNCGTSLVNVLPVNYPYEGYFYGDNDTYYDVNFMGPGLLSGSGNYHSVVFATYGRAYASGIIHTAIFNGNGELGGRGHYDDLYFTPGYAYTINDTVFINSTLHANGTCAAHIDIHSNIPGTQKYISQASGTVNTSDLILKDIKATGGANFIAANSADMGNNTGWNITAVAGQDLYWIGNGGNWSNGNHWSLTSGGAPSGCTPSPLDNVHFDINSFANPGQTVLINMPTIYCRNMTWTGVTNHPSFTGSNPNYQWKIHGSLAFDPGMNASVKGQVLFEATNTGQTITMSGKSFSADVIFIGIGGGWIFADAFSTNLDINLYHGNLNTNSQIVNARGFHTSVYVPDTITLNLGASVFNVVDGFIISEQNAIPPLITLDAGTSVINISNGDFGGGFHHTYNDVNFTDPAQPSSGLGGFGMQIHNVVFASQLGTISSYVNDSIIFNSLTFLGDGRIWYNNHYNDLIFTAGHTYTIMRNSTQTINNHWRIQGSCTSYIVLETDMPGTFASFIKPSGDVLGYNIHIKDIHCNGGANYMAYNSVDLGGNSGWNFSILPPLNNPNGITGPTQVCSGQSNAVLYHIAPVPGAISYTWTVPAGATIVSGQGDTSIVVNFGAATSGNIVVQSFNGCNYGTIASILTVVISQQPVPLVSIVADTTGPVCQGATIIFTTTALNTGGGTVNYNFLVNGTSVQSSNSNVFATTTLSNNDEVNCIVTVSAAACSGSVDAVSDTITVSVFTDPAPDPHISITASPAGQSCAGVPVTFSASVTGNGNSNIIYDFQINGASVQTGSSGTFVSSTLSNNDQVSCVVTTTATTCFAPVTVTSDVITASIYNDPAPDPHISITISPEGQVCEGDPLTFTATVTGWGSSGINYNFKVNNIIVQQGSSGIFTTTDLLNNDKVECSIQVAGGTCFAATAATSDVIIVNERNCDDCALHIPNAITSNGDGINDNWVISHRDCFRQVNVFVYNRYGSLVYQKNNYQNDWEGRYGSKTLPDGTYYYIIKAITIDQREQIFRGNITILR